MAGQKGEEAHTQWGVLYANDAGIVSQTAPSSEKMTAIVVKVCI